MKPGPPKGTPKPVGSGRQKGTLNTPKPGVGYVKDLMESLGINTFRELALAAVGELPCKYCKRSPVKGKLLQTILVDEKTGEVRDVWLSCRACQGQGFEMIAAQARMRALDNLNVFQQPRLSHATLDGDLKVNPNGETLQEMASKIEAIVNAKT